MESLSKLQMFIEQYILLLTVDSWCRFQSTTDLQLQAPMLQYLLAFFIYFILFSLFNLFPKPRTSLFFTFLFKTPSFYNTLHRSVTWLPVPCDLHSLYTDSSGCDNLNSPSLYNNFTSNLPCPTKIWTACQPITRFVVALMDAGLGMCEANTIASKLRTTNTSCHNYHGISLLIFTSWSTRTGIWWQWRDVMSYQLTNAVCFACERSGVRSPISPPCDDVMWCRITYKCYSLAVFSGFISQTSCLIYIFNRLIQFICILESQVVECSMGSFYTKRF